MAEETQPVFRYPSSGRRPERLNQSRGVNAPLQLARGWAAGLLGLPGDVEGLVRMLPGLDETPRLPTSDFYREYLPGYDPAPAARAMSGLGALTGGAGATGAVRGGLGAVKRATDVNAMRDYVRAAQGMSGLPGTAVVKPKGGNWLKGPGAPDDAVQVLKVRDRFGMTDPTEISSALGIPLEEAQALHASNAPNAALNQWIDQKLAKYMRNEMGTPEDSVRKLAERGVLHFDPEAMPRYMEDVWAMREKTGFPAMQGTSPLAQKWEAYADQMVRAKQLGEPIRTDKPLGLTMKDYIASMPGGEWAMKAPDEQMVYELRRPGTSSAQVVSQELGLDHLIDELRNATRAGSDLPRELQLKPEQLSKVTMPQAVELVDRINKWRAAQKAEADLARSTNAATQTFKEYPEQGYKWVEIKTPEEAQALPEGYSVSVITNENLPAGHMGRNSYAVVDPQGRMLEDVGMAYTEADAVGKFKRSYYGKSLEDALKYEGETMGHCVGGHCPDVMEGRSRIFSLRDAKGQPHVTIELEPSSSNTIRSMREGTATDFDIKQIKGKANKAPKDEYLPYVQDFVKSQRWGRVGDAQNAGLADVDALRSGRSPGVSDDIFKRLVDAGLRERGDVLEGVRYGTVDEIIKLLGSKPEPRQGFARGGAVRAPAAGPATYDPDRIAALADQLMSMEA